MPKVKPFVGRSVRERSRFALDRRETHGFWSWDAQRDCVWADTSVALLFNLDPEEAEAGLPLSVFASPIHPSDQPRVLALFRSDGREDGGGPVEYRVRGADGSLRLVLFRGRFTYDHHGRPLSGRGIIADISDLQAWDADRAPAGVYDAAPPTLLLDQAAAAAIAAFQAIGALDDPGLTAQAEALLFEIGRKLALQEAAGERNRLN